MSVTIESNIAGQYTSGNLAYCYLYEPYFITVGENNGADKIYIDLVLKNTSDNSVVENISRYGEYDLAPNVKFTIDLMKLARQYHDSNIYKIGSITDIVTEQGEQSVVSKLIYEFRVYSNISSTTTTIERLPIIGGRSFDNFDTNTLTSDDLTEFKDIDLTNRWNNVPVITNTLSSLSSTDKSPNITWTVSSLADNKACGGFIVYKSSLGGWCSWGMDYKSINKRGSYTGRLNVGFLESNNLIGGNKYIAADYTSRNVSKTVDLKSFSLSKDELIALSGITNSPAVYYSENGFDNLELMRLSRVTAPINTFINGGDLSISLSSISTQEFKTR